MITSEASTYVLSGCLIGAAIGLPLHYWLFHVMITGYWGDSWQIPVIPMMVILAIITVTTVGAVYGPIRRIWNRSITELTNDF